MKTVIRYRNVNEAISDISLGLLEPKSPVHRLPLFKNTHLEDRKDLLNAISTMYHRIQDLQDLEFIINFYTPFTGVEIKLELKEAA